MRPLQREREADSAFDAGEAVGEGGHVGADFLVGDFGVDLGGADVRVAEDAAEGFDRHAAVEGQRGEGMAADMEGQVLADAAAGGQVLQVLVAGTGKRRPSGCVPRYFSTRRNGTSSSRTFDSTPVLWRRTMIHQFPSKKRRTLSSRRFFTST